MIQVWERCRTPHIYMVFNMLNEKAYIGQHTGKRTNYFASGTVVNKAIAKYGQENFSRIILEYWEVAPDNLDEIEANYINIYQTLTPNGYNVSKVGTGRLQYGGTPWNKGGGKYSDEVIEKMSNSHKGKVLSEEHKKSISESQKGRKPSDKCIQSKIEKSSIPVEQYTLDGTFIRDFSSVTEAAKSVNTSSGHVSRTCNGKYKSCKGYLFKYKNIEQVALNQ